MTMGELVTLYYNSYSHYNSPKTIESYKQALNHLPTEILCKNTENITVFELQSAINATWDKYPRQAQILTSALKKILTKAAQAKLAAPPPEALERPPHTPKKTSVLTLENLKIYAKTAKKHGKTGKLLIIGMLLGLRRGEMLGLRYSDINRADNTITIQRQRIRTQQGYIEKPLKTKSSLRTIPITQDIYELIPAQAGSPDTFIVNTTPETLRKTHLTILQESGLPKITLHGLRHSIATAHAAKGTPPEILKTILGHSKISITMDLYAAHITPNDSRNSIQSVVEAITAIPQKAHDWKSCLPGKGN